MYIIFTLNKLFLFENISKLLLLFAEKLFLLTTSFISKEANLLNFLKLVLVLFKSEFNFKFKSSFLGIELTFLVEFLIKIPAVVVFLFNAFLLFFALSSNFVSSAFIFPFIYCLTKLPTFFLEIIHYLIHYIFLGISFCNIFH